MEYDKDEQTKHDEKKTRKNCTPRKTLNTYTDSKAQIHHLSI